MSGTGTVARAEQTVEALPEVKATVVPSTNGQLTIIKLTRPQKINGAEVSTIEMNLVPLKGRNIRDIIGQFNTLYKEYVPVPTVDLRFQAMVGAYAAKMNPLDLEELDAPDYMKVCMAVRDFLLG